MFLYCGNNPVNLTDPSGTIVITVSTAIVILDIFCITAIAGVLTVGLHQAFAAPLPQTEEKPHFTEIIPFPNNNQQPKNKGKVDPIVPPIPRPKPQTNPTRNQPPAPNKIYAANTAYPGAYVYAFEPLSLEEAAIRIYAGRDVWVETGVEAKNLCIRVKGAYTGPEQNGRDNAWHYHPGVGNSRSASHIFYGYENVYWVNF